MKKIMALLLALVMVGSLAACGSEKPAADDLTEENVSADITDEAADGVGMKSPVTDYESLEKLNDATGANLAKPAVMGVTDESFCSIIDNDCEIAQYKFAVNGRNCTLRFSSDFTKDISGIYVGEKTAFEGVEGEDTIKTPDGMAARWMNVDGQYVFAVEGKDLDEEWFDTLTDEMKSLVLRVDSEDELEAIYNSLEGNYQDKVSQRATAEVDSLGKDGIKIEVKWAQDANTEYEWEMTAKKGEDGLFSYYDCKLVVEDYSNSADGVETVKYTKGEGHFTVNDEGNLVWDGAADENCASCIFEKIPDAD